MSEGFIATNPNAEVVEQKEGRVKDKPRANWMFFFHPHEWQVDVHGRIVPVLSQMSMSPGAGADPSGDFTPQKRLLESRGWVAIPHSVLRRELGIKDYVVRYVNHRGKGVCRSIFQTPFTDGTGQTGWKMDEEAYDAFIELLRQREIIPPPQPRIIQQLLDSERRRMAFLTDRRPDERNAPAVQRHEIKVRRCERAIENLEEELHDSIRVYGEEAAPVRSKLVGALRQATQRRQAEQHAVATVGARLAQGLGFQAPSSPNDEEQGDEDWRPPRRSSSIELEREDEPQAQPTTGGLDLVGREQPEPIEPPPTGKAAREARRRERREQEREGRGGRGRSSATPPDPAHVRTTTPREGGFLASAPSSGPELGMDVDGDDDGEDE